MTIIVISDIIEGSFLLIVNAVALINNNYTAINNRNKTTIINNNCTTLNNRNKTTVINNNCTTINNTSIERKLIC